MSTVEELVWELFAEATAKNNGLHTKAQQHEGRVALLGWW